MPDPKDQIARYFSEYYEEGDYLQKTVEALMPFGFTKDNSIAAVCICRDEISQPFMGLARQLWGEVFNLSALGGMFLAGKMALKAAIHHAPEDTDKRRYVFYALPHIAIDDKGQLGVCRRKGIQKSTACGALITFYKELQNSQVNVSYDEQDPEMSLLRQRLIKSVSCDELPNLLEFTRVAQRVLQNDIESAISQVVDSDTADYALFTGLQIHAGDSKNYVVAKESYAIVNKSRYNLLL